MELLRLSVVREMLVVEAAADAVVHDIVKLAVVLHVRLLAMV